ncbi:MAG: EAL domain-containing protein [Gammaproteobacteria bacterium]|nr:EAL domain-containing protein [Gammaproteobacteria bacterium]
MKSFQFVRATAAPKLRWLLLIAALALPVLLTLTQASLSERRIYHNAERSIDQLAHEDARAESELIKLRLMQQFNSLAFVASSLDGTASSRALDPQSHKLMTGFARHNPQLYALNLLSADGNRIVWSTRKQPSRPITPGTAFTPIAGLPQFLLGRTRYSRRVGGYVITMRYRVADASGRTSYFVGSPYRIDQLLANNAPSPFTLVVRDLRDDRILGVLSQGHLVDTRKAPQPRAKVAVLDAPLEVQASFPQSLVWQQYRRGLGTRLSFWAAIVTLLTASGLAIALLIRKRDLQAEKITRLSSFHALLAQVHQAMIEAQDEATLLQTVCDLAVRHAGMALAWIGRPGTGNRFEFLASAGPEIRYMDGLTVSTDPEVPEGQGRGGRAWREGEPYFGPGFAQAPQLKYWRDRADACGLKANAVLPIRRAGHPWGIVTFYAAQSDVFDRDIADILRELARHLSGGLDRLDTIARTDLLTRALDSMSDGVFLATADQACIYVNAAFTQITGYPAAEAIGRNCRFLQGPETEPAAVARVHAALAKFEAVNADILNYRKDGSPFWNALAITPLRNAQGEVTHFVGTQRDITERKQLETSLADASGFNAALLAGLTVGVNVTRYPAHVIEYANNRFLEILRAPDIERVLGHSPHILWPDEATRARASELVQTVLHEGHGLLADMPLQRMDGTIGWADISGHRLERSDGVQRIVWTQVDATERHEIDAKVRALNTMREALLANTEAAISMVQYPERVIVEVNQAFLDLIGCAGPEEVIGREIHQFCAATTEDLRLTGLAETVLVDGNGGVPDLQLRRKDGALIYVSAHGRRVGPDDSRHPIIVWTAVDVTQRRQQERRIEQLQRLYRSLLVQGNVVLRSHGEAEMMEQTCTRLVHETLFHAVWISRPGEDGLIHALARSGSGSEHAASARLHIDDPTALAARAWREGRTVYYNDNFGAQRDTAWHAYHLRYRWASLLATPIRRENRVWGLLVFAAPEPEAFDPRTIEVCERVADLLGHGLDELELKRRLNELRSEEAHRARHDALTGLLNRFALEQHLPQAIARARRNGTLVAVTMIDLDDFKPVNDSYGHDAGDELLRQLVKRLQARLRASSLIARLGGDEFIVVIEDLLDVQVTQQLRSALSRLHEAVESPFDLGQGREAEVGMSVGVALYPQDAEEPDALLRAADAAMYQAKTHKASRATWWSLGSPHFEDSEQEVPFDPFGSEAQRLLDSGARHFEEVAQEFVRTLHVELSRQTEPSAILACLTPDGLEALEARQIGHLRLLFNPQTTAGAIEQSARRLGQVHALIGVNGAWISQAMSLYRGLLRQRLDGAASVSRNRHRMLRAADARLQLDLQTELDTMQKVTDTYNAHLARPLPRLQETWTSLAQGELDALAALPGIRACQLLRPQPNGVFAVEFSAGTVEREVRCIMHTPEMVPQLDTRAPSGRGLIGSAWRMESIQRTDAYGLDERTRLWHADFQALGIQSMVTIPVQRVKCLQFVLAIEGAYPHQFSTIWAQTFTASLQNRWNQIAQLTQTPAAPVPAEMAAQYRALLYSGGLRMYMQPVANLTSGAIVKFEALARLVAADGALIAPAQFLPALDDSDLDVLFRAGLDQGLEWLRRWNDEGLDIDLSLNLAPSTLMHADCARWVEEALHRHAIDPHRLTLELLENQEFEEARRDEAIGALLRVGVRLAIDDLGSGYSSLKRLASLPFDIVKVDQALIRDIATDPVKTLSLVRTIVQIGHDFDREVVVEGAEDLAVIEAASILGARLGQGYGIAHPMPAEEVLPWTRARTWQGVDTRTIHTYLGALAYHWAYRHDHTGRHARSREDCPLTAFLQGRGLGKSDAARWHSETHEPGGGADCRAASRLLMDWLAGQVREEARAPRTIDDTGPPAKACSPAALPDR